jgi:hypothetical protein
MIATATKPGFWTMVTKIYAAIGTAADAIGNVADTANNLSKVASLKSNVYLQESTLEDEARLAELRLKLAHRLEQVKKNPVLLEDAPEPVKQEATTFA